MTMEKYLTERKVRKFSELTDDEVREIVSDIFCPKKITCIKRNKRDDEISCKIYTEWDPYEKGDKPFVLADELVLYNPFFNGNRSISIDMGIGHDDYEKLRQFCFARGVETNLDKYLVNNPYLKETCTSHICQRNHKKKKERKQNV